MKKFEEVEKLKSLPEKETEEEPKELSEQQLEEVFKRTSMFSMKAVAAPEGADLDGVWEDDIAMFDDDAEYER